MIARLGFGLGLFVGSLALGWGLGRVGMMTEARASRLVRWIIQGPAPLMLCLSFWRMNLRSAEPWLLPMVGFLVSASALLPAFLYTRSSRLTKPQAGSFLTCAFFSNLGYLGAYAAYALFGETAYALCVLYFMFFTPCFYTIGFGIASRYGQQRRPSALKDALNNELRLYPFLGMLVGASLSLLGVPRPALLEQLNHVLITGDTVLDLVAVGSQIVFISPRPWWKPCLAMSAVKFLFTPFVAWLLVRHLHLHGLPRIVVLLEASTPVGVSPLLLPLLFGLDRRLSNALWLFTTLAAIPWLLIVIPVLQQL